MRPFPKAVGCRGGEDERWMVLPPRPLDFFFFFGGGDEEGLGPSPFEFFFDFL